ncbi:hypothetical protein A2U01_0069491, partial [Trifolium medium]|nr:hypothetical protein [Trifolium medium]
YLDFFTHGFLSQMDIPAASAGDVERVQMGNTQVWLSSP